MPDFSQTRRSFNEDGLQTVPRGNALLSRRSFQRRRLPSANTFVNMFNTLTGFTYRGLPCLAIAFGEGGSPHEFTPPDRVGIFDMPGVHKCVEQDAVTRAAHAWRYGDKESHLKV